MNDEILYSIALRHCNNIGDGNFKKILDHFGSAELAWTAHKNEFKKISGIGPKTISEIGNIEHLRFAEKEIIFCDKNLIQVLVRNQANYPKHLNHCDDAPAILYIKGNYDDSRQSVSIVGTRNMTSYGKHFIDELISYLKSKNITTISGLAYGVDAYAHELSIQNDIPTTAVLAHGLHMLYPAKHKNLAEKIIENNGAILSEFNSTGQPDREHFIQRNRVIAGLSKTTIVIESAFGGGSMSTVTFANDYNREVFALPGKVTDKYSQGCNLLIAQNKAECIVSAKDLVEKIITEPYQQLDLFKKNRERPPISGITKIVLDIINDKITIHLDDIIALTNLPSHQLLPILLDLELKEYIKSSAGRQYQPLD